MPMFIWRVEFDYQLEGSEDWARDVVHHLGSENGGEAVNFVREKLIGSEVAVRVGVPMFFVAPGPVNTIDKIMVDWRLAGLTQICKINTLDITALEAAGVLEVQHDEVEAPADKQVDLTVEGVPLSADEG